MLLVSTFCIIPDPFAQLMTQRVGIPRSSAAESYVQKNDKHLWERMKKYTFNSIEEGIQGLK